MESKQLRKRLLQIFPPERVFTDELSRLVKGTDAGLYRLIPKAVVKADTEEEVIRLLKFCSAENLPVTFKAAGTSLSGQTISDSILMETGNGFEYSAITREGDTATFGCGLTGAAANRMLLRYKRKLGPKPASIHSAKIGGIIANNASGSSYGILHNSYNTIRSMRIILADGSLLDTADSESCRAFTAAHPQLIAEIRQLHRDAVNNKTVRQKIAAKFQLKNTCGYGVNSLIDFSDPIRIIQHLMIGSEGTLGFVSQATFETVHDAPLKAAAMVYFSNLRDVSDTIVPLRSCRVNAAELMDRNALRAVENQEGMPEELKTLPEGAAALLIDTSADDEETLQAQMAEIEEKLSHIETLYPIGFTTDKHLYDLYWNVRNGLFTSAAATRPPHTACIIEDIAFAAVSLGDALTDVRALLVRTGYENAVMWGHLLDGNVHFTVFPDINAAEGVEKYASFMRELCELTAVKHGGSLKAEHGTGRNMAPFVEKEWGNEVYNLMKRIKKAFDPGNILNPGVLINDEPAVFIQNLKQIPEANPVIDKCIECGFCEVDCPSKNLTLTPRQRIVAYRHLAEKAVLKQATPGKKESRAIRKQVKQISYPLEETCATDGLCGIACPVGIDTGKLIKELRWRQNGWFANRAAGIIANHIAGTTSLLRGLLPVPHYIGKIAGYRVVESVAKGLYRLGDGLIPLWTRHTPSGSKKIKQSVFKSDTISAPYTPDIYEVNDTSGVSFVPGKSEGSFNPGETGGSLVQEETGRSPVQGETGVSVIPCIPDSPSTSGAPNTLEAVYFPACITRAMGGPSFGYQETEDVPQKMLSVLRKAGYTVIIPEGKDNLCCGMAFSSKGFREQARKKENELNEALLKASRNGELPIVCDMSPCLLHIRETLDKRLKLYDQVEFIHDFLLNRLQFVRQPVTVAIHTTCSSAKMHLEEKLHAVALRCAEKVIVHENIGCCGWAGDRGFFYPELNKSALAPLKQGIRDATEGYSNSRTCETGLSLHSGITYKSIVYLVDKATI